MDIPSVRFQPVPEQAQAAITSTQGHPRLIWPIRPKFNTHTHTHTRARARTHTHTHSHTPTHTFRLIYYNMLNFFYYTVLFITSVAYIIIIPFHQNTTILTINNLTKD